MKRRTLLTAGLLLCFGAAFAWFAGINGKWTGSITTPDGNLFPISYTFKTDGNKLTGTHTTTFGTVDIEGGTIKGDSLSFSVNVDGTTIPHTGKYFSAGDSVSLNIDYQGTKFHTTLKRVTDNK